MADAKFVENHDITVIDICNFFGVPAYKVNAGKQSYSSNEQNAIEYVTGPCTPSSPSMSRSRPGPCCCRPSAGRGWNCT